MFTLFSYVCQDVHILSKPAVMSIFNAVQYRSLTLARIVTYYSVHYLLVNLLIIQNEKQTTRKKTSLFQGTYAKVGVEYLKRY